MRRLPRSLVIGLILTTAPLVAEYYYKLPDIERVEKNLYRSAKVLIATRSCIHLPVDQEDALLKYRGPGDYEIVWEDLSICEVEKVVALDENDADIAFHRHSNRNPGLKEDYVARRSETGSKTHD